MYVNTNLETYMESKITTVSPSLDVEKAVEMVGGSRFELILIAATRAREIAQKRNIANAADSSLKFRMKPNIEALQEIEEGKIGRDYLSKVAKAR